MANAVWGERVGELERRAEGVGFAGKLTRLRGWNRSLVFRVK
jgi:hypothetical protein